MFCQHVAMDNPPCLHFLLLHSALFHFSSLPWNMFCPFLVYKLSVFELGHSYTDMISTPLSFEACILGKKSGTLVTINLFSSDHPINTDTDYNCPLFLDMGPPP